MDLSRIRICSDLGLATIPPFIFPSPTMPQSPRYPQPFFHQNPAWR
jgi:hypothetical protein